MVDFFTRTDPFSLVAQLGATVSASMLLIYGVVLIQNNHRSGVRVLSHERLLGVVVLTSALAVGFVHAALTAKLGRWPTFALTLPFTCVIQAVSMAAEGSRALYDPSPIEEKMLWRTDFNLIRRAVSLVLMYEVVILANEF